VIYVASMTQAVPDQIDFPREEEKILQLWKELNAFHTSLLQSKNRPRSENCCILFGIIHFDFFGGYIEILLTLLLHRGL